MNYIDRFLNSITMYQLVLWCLRILVIVTFLLSAFNILSLSFFGLIYSLIILIAVCLATNYLFAKIYDVQASNESYAITALILFLILAPVATFADAGVIALAAFIAIASKYVLAIRNRHIFNPAAISLVVISLLGYGQAIWWIGSAALLPFTLVAGFLIVRKIRRFPLFLSFFVVALIEIVTLGIAHDISFSSIFIQAFTSWPLIFFGTVMLTEPATMPSSRNLQIIFGAIIGLLFGSQWNIGPLFATPEFALCVGNVFAFVSSSRPKLRLTLKEKKNLAENIEEFSFTYPHSKERPLAFLPGQYMEWTFAHKKADTRGYRRYFTIASSPTEEDIKIGIRIQNQAGSTFKTALSGLKEGSQLMAGSLAGDFVLPKNQQQKLAFIGGGIGITPFRSMVKYLTDIHEKRDVVLFYAANMQSQFAYQDIFKAAETVGVKTHYVLPSAGLISKEVIQKDVPDFLERHWYISGPNTMVEIYTKILASLGITSAQIKKDYFPGF